METTIKVTITNKNIILTEFTIIGSIKRNVRLPFLFDVTFFSITTRKKNQKYFEKDSENLSESGSLERNIEQKKVILIQKGADVNKRNSSRTLKN